MGWQQTTQRLMDAIIRRDEQSAAEISVGLCADREPFQDWRFLRWDAQEECLRPLWPAGEQAKLDLSADLKERLEKGEPIAHNVHSEAGNGNGNGARATSSAFWIPLVYGDQLQGVLQGQAEQGDLSGELRQRVGLLARGWFLVGLLEEKERLLYRDPLTGLNNADFLMDFLKRELSRASRYQRNVAVVFLDIDWFKNVNDMHGHLMGSHVLREIGRLL
ncbi:MAG TPA: GGDEF domain-containing protein, partial [Acidobacteriota bacterium]|nr:GGDEF domain-containing protein [Acidobacteriota bacterium]